MTRVDITDLDTIYLSYDEEQADRHWAIIKSEIPWAKRVHGVKGSDAAHKAAADASRTDRFILIDGDNLPNWNFFNQTLELDETNSRVVFRWRAKNHINELCYGNGGISSWSKEFALNMRTHESSPGDDSTAIEFCYDPDYWAMYDTWSTTYPNASPKQAWRAGFREGVKMCLDQGSKPTPSEFATRLEQGNLRHLKTWMSVGRDVINGTWAIAGARQGAHDVMLTDWNYREVQDFDWLEAKWRTLESKDPEEIAAELLEDINWSLELEITELTAAASKLFKDLREPRPNLGIMLREGDVNRVITQALNE